MVKVNFSDVKKECKCYSCNKEIIENDEKFSLKVGNLDFDLCVDCGNDLINKMLEAWNR